MSDEKELVYDPKSWTRRLSLKSGDLTRFGYSAYASQREKARALAKALKAYGYSKVIRKLNVLANLNVNRPELHRIYRADLHLAQQLAQRLKIADPFIISFDPIRVEQEAEKDVGKKSNRMEARREKDTHAAGQSSSY